MDTFDAEYAGLSSVIEGMWRRICSGRSYAVEVMAIYELSTLLARSRVGECVLWV